MGKMPQHAAIRDSSGIRIADHPPGHRCKLIRLSFSHTEVRSFDDLAVLYSLWTTETEIHGRRSVSSGRATEIFVRSNGQWLNAGWHLDSGK